MTTFADKWFNIYYGLMTKRTYISKRNLILMQYKDMYPEECYITNELINEVETLNK